MDGWGVPPVDGLGEQLSRSSIAEVRSSSALRALGSEPVVHLLHVALPLGALDPICKARTILHRWEYRLAKMFTNHLTQCLTKQ